MLKFWQSCYQSKENWTLNAPLQEDDASWQGKALRKPKQYANRMDHEITWNYKNLENKAKKCRPSVQTIVA